MFHQLFSIKGMDTIACIHKLMYTFYHAVSETCKSIISRRYCTNVNINNFFGNIFNYARKKIYFRWCAKKCKIFHIYSSNSTKVSIRRLKRIALSMLTYRFNLRILYSWIFYRQQSQQVAINDGAA